MHHRRAAAVAAATISLGAAPAAHAIVFGQLDDFENGTVMNWRKGGDSTVPPTNVPNDGPNGAGDNFLRNASLGGQTHDSRQTIYNLVQWSGDYTTAGVTRITAMMRNLGTTPLHMRAALFGGSVSTWYSSGGAAVLPVGGGWQPVTFDLTSAAMTRVDGNAPLSSVLSNVTTLRIVSAEAGPAWQGDQLATTIGIDNLRAMRLPGDANFDGNVNLNDFNVLASNFGTATGATWQQADFNFDGNVNLNDFNLLAAHFGQSVAGAGVMP